MPESPVDIAGGSPSPDWPSPDWPSSNRPPPDWGTRHLRPPPPEPQPRPYNFVANLRQRRVILFAIIVLVPLSTWITLRQIQPQFTASGSLVYQATEYQPRELQSMMRVDPINEQVMATQAEILQSMRIAEQVAQRGKLFDNPSFNPSIHTPNRLRAILRRLLGMDEDEAPVEEIYGPTLDKGQAATLQAVRNALHATPAHVSHVIEVSFAADDPNIAAAGVNNAMDAYIKGLYAEKYQKIDQAKQQLEDQARDLRHTVATLEKQVSDYREKHGLNQGIHASLDTEQITRLLEDLAKARTDLAAANAKVDAARSGRGAADSAAITPSVVAFRTRRDQVRERLQAQLTRLGPAHPETQALKQQLAQADAELDAETARVIAADEAEQHAATMRVQSAEQALDAMRKAADDADHAQLPLNMITRDLDAARTQLNAVLEGIQSTKLQAGVEFPEAHEISLALPPEHPSSPRKAQTMLAASAAGVFLALLAVHVLQLLDDTLQSGDTIRTATGLSCFALIPELSRRSLGPLRPHEYAARRPLTAFAEQIRALRAAVGLDADRPRIIAITAARPAEGKSVLSLSLGRSAQTGGERVLAIECDVRQPSFHPRLGSGPTPPTGLLDILRNEVEWRDTVQEDRVTGMAYITAGRATRGGTDILGLFMSDTLRRVLAEVRDAYDLIVLDCPPVEAMTEARIAAGLADATLVCVRWRRTQSKTLHHALHLLHDAHAKVIGAVLTRVDTREHLRSGNADAGVYHRRYKAYFRG
jgi:polysaccharide biosynthesis transport protein